ncbi:MAG: hypothetical protein ABJF10_04880, partial [Chthoniobacter sp.]|uniref:hypothetical protein n=1 Tax=Chthoniobacter sp. TaxID=2510640 RepID=UPI0032AD1464
DRDELQNIVAFIRGGGLELARERELERLKETRRRPSTATATTEALGRPVIGPNPWSEGRDLIDVLLFLGGALARLFMK